MPKPMFLILLISLGCGALITLGLAFVFRPVNSTWLTAQGSSPVVAGTAFHLKLQLAQAETGFLNVDIHGIGVGGEALGFLAAAVAQEIQAETLDYEFQIEVPTRDGLISIFPIIFISTGSDWQGRIKDVSMEPLDIVPARSLGAGSGARGRFSSLRPQLVWASTEKETAFSLPLRLVLAIIWLAVCTVFLVPSIALGQGLMDGGRKNLGMGFACLAAFVWAIFSPDAFFAALFRSNAVLGGWYFLRQGPQTLLSFFLVGTGTALGLGLFFINLRHDMLWNGFVLLGLLVFFFVSGLRLISYHGMDFILGMNLLGISLGWALQAAAALCALVGALFQLSTLKKSRG